MHQLIGWFCRSSWFRVLFHGFEFHLVTGLLHFVITKMYKSRTVKASAEWMLSMWNIFDKVVDSIWKCKFRTANGIQCYEFLWINSNGVQHDGNVKTERTSLQSICNSKNDSFSELKEHIFILNKKMGINWFYHINARTKCAKKNVSAELVTGRRCNYSFSHSHFRRFQMQSSCFFRRLYSRFPQHIT